MPKVRKGSFIAISGMGLGVVVSKPKTGKHGKPMGDVFWLRPGAFVSENERFTREEYLDDAKIIAG